MKKLVLLGCIAGLTATAQNADVTFYNVASLSSEMIHETVRVLRRIFHFAGIDINWDEAVLPSVFVVDFSPAGAGKAGYEQRCRALRAIHVRVLSAPPPHVDTRTLGYSMPFSARGINVTMYEKEVEAIAVRETIPLSTLLAHGMAHEIGHVLMRSSAHSQSGLMSSSWTSHEYDRMRQTVLRFSDDNARAIRAALAGEGCADPRVLSSRAGKP
jgi:hypothetical protein